MSVPGLFTHGSPNQRLPHPPVPTRLLLAAHAAFIEAFAMLRATPPAGFSLASAQEKVITRQLKDILANNLLPSGSVPGFNQTYFSYVTRDAELTSYNGAHPDKKPDILIGLKRANGARIIADQDAVFVECKPVDATHRLTGAYGIEGIRRFVEGEYAWAMTSAMMVAYVRGNFTLARELRANFRSNSNDARFGKPSLCGIVSGSASGMHHEALRGSRHRRTFRWPANGRLAAAIVLYHSCHNCE